jgi:hypothetical protein
MILLNHSVRIWDNYINLPQSLSSPVKFRNQSDINAWGHMIWWPWIVNFHGGEKKWPWHNPRYYYGHLHSGIGNVPTSWPEWRGFKPGGGRRIFKDGKIQGTSPPGGISSSLTRVVDLLHVKEPQVPMGPLSKIYRHFPSNSSGRWWCAFYLSALDRKGLEFGTTVLW